MRVLLLQLLTTDVLLVRLALDFASCLVMNHLSHGAMDLDTAVGGSLHALVKTLEPGLVCE